MQVQKVALEKIKPSPFNPRKDFNKDALAELAASLTQHGQQEPIKVRPVNGHFEIVFGERRYRAAQLAGLKDLDAIVEQLDDKTTDVLRLVENVKRRDLTVFEEAEHLKLLHEKHKVKVEDLATQVGIAVRTVRENIKLATVAPSVRERVLSGDVKLSAAKLISRLPKPEDQEKVAKLVVDQQMTHEEVEKYLRETYMQDLRYAPFDVKQKGLACLAATCVECPRNARNLKEEMPDLKGADVCTSPPDYRKKCRELARVKAAEMGARLLTESEVEPLFNKWGEMNRVIPFHLPDAPHPKDAKGRTWRQLLSKDELKKRLALALTPKNELLELLDDDGIEAAVKDRLEKAPKGASTPRDHGQTRAEADKDYAASQLRARVINAVLPKLVEKITKQPKLHVFQAVAKQLISDSDVDYSRAGDGEVIDLPQRRGWESPEQAEKAIEKMDNAEVAALIFETAFGWHLGRNFGGYSEHLKDFCKLYGIDLKKAEANEKTSITGRELAETIKASPPAPLGKTKPAKKPAPKKTAKAKKGGGK